MSIMSTLKLLYDEKSEMLDLTRACMQTAKHKAEIEQLQDEYKELLAVTQDLKKLMKEVKQND